LNATGIAHKEAGRLDEAAEAYEQALAIDPDWSTPLYNLGLVRKHQKRWQESLDFNRHAAALDPANEAAWWNMGIAATAVGNWDLARAAWRGFGLEGIPDGDGPIDFPCGVGPVRLNPDDVGEVVWGYRLDPARMVLLSVPLPASGHCWSDIVLNDGAPVGYRRYQGRELPVFDALALLDRSPFGTYAARVEMPPDRELIERLGQAAREHGGAAEDWKTMVRMLCRACSEGRPHDRHEEEPIPEGDHLIGIAARSRDHASEILTAWAAGQASVRVIELHNALLRS
jgi:hypothetical protein